jgi:magnesium transporter
MPLVCRNLMSLLEEGNLQSAKLLLGQASPQEIVFCLRLLESPRRALVFRLLDKERALAVFEALDRPEQAELVKAMEDPDLLPLLEGLKAEERVI